MKLSTLTAALACVASAIVGGASDSSDAEKWTYAVDDDHLAGPAHWGDVYSTCAGKRQSPINIVLESHPAQDTPLTFSGSCDDYKITEHYDAFKAEVDGGSCSVTSCDKTFSFAQVHFHSPSEHTIDGEAFDAEAHFVHKAADGKVLVVGVFLQRAGDNSSSTDPFFASFVEGLCDVEDGAPVSASLGPFQSSIEKAFDDGRVFNYFGGLTVPPCDEIVEWWVVEAPLAISHSDYETVCEQLTRIQAAAPDGENARPTQPLNGRLISVY